MGVGLYFSAHWCPPWRGFTPDLSKAYTDNLKKNGMEIVFISSDRDEGGFKSYFDSMADWYALPFSERDKKQELGEKYGVNGIPCFIVLDGNSGEVITKDG